MIALHVAPQTVGPRDVCGADLPTQPCSEFSVDAAATLVSQYVYLVAAVADSGATISLLDCGVIYYNLTVVDWRGCADGEFPRGSWPESYGANRIAWSPSTNCQTTLRGEFVQAVAGAFYVYAYDEGYMEVIRDNWGNVKAEFLVEDCYGVETEVTTNGGRVAFGSGEGFNPCLSDVSPVQASTWGRLKQAYGEP